MNTQAPNEPLAHSAAQPGATDGLLAWQSRWMEQAEPSGTATTADGPEAPGEIGPMSESLGRLLEARGLDPEPLVMRGWGASDRLGGDTLAIPYFDNGARAGTKYRTLGETKRFAQDKGSRQILWNVDCLRDPTLANEPLIVTEGEMDAAAALQAGYSRVVSVPGGAPATITGEGADRKYRFLDEAKTLLDDVREIILAVDSDGPGANLQHDLALRLGRARCKWVAYPKGCKDLGDALREFGVRGVQKTIQRAQWMPVPGIYRMSEVPPADDSPALDCGMDGLGEHYRLRLGDFVVVTGIPGMGKTTVINEIACRMAYAHGWNVVSASFEQRTKPDHQRFLRSFHGHKAQKAMTSAEIEAADAWIERHFTFLLPDDETDATLEWTLDVCAAAVRRNGANLVIVDPWNEMDHDRPPDMSLTEYTGFAIKSFKRFAKRHRVHLIVAAHPAKMQRGKDGKYPVPSLYDISDSAHWSNKPDLGIVVHRESLQPGGKSIIRVVKSRYHDVIGKPGEITGVFDAATSRYQIDRDDGGMFDER